MPPPSHHNESDPLKAGSNSPRPPIGGPPKMTVAAKPGEKPKAGAVPPKPEKAPAGDGALVPPDDTIWEKYCANGEPVLSGLASTLLHGLGLLVIVVGIGWLFSSSPPVVDELEPVEIGNGEEGGGGGNVAGVDPNNPGNLTRPPDEVKSLDQDKSPMKTLPENDPMVKANTTPIIDDTADTFVEKLKSKQNTAPLTPVLKDALEGLAGKGLGGGGRGGGEGEGVGKGRGSGTGDGTGRTNRRGRRVLRWEMVFSTNDAHHYLQQLDALGAIIAVPDKGGRLMTIRDLKNPKPQYEDVKALNRIYWVDDRRDSAESIADALKLDIIPSAIVAFFPVELEQQLLSKELAFRGRKEEDIEYTKFAISFSGGKPVIKVIEQRAFPGRR